MKVGLDTSMISCQPIKFTAQNKAAAQVNNFKGDDKVSDAQMLAKAKEVIYAQDLYINRLLAEKAQVASQPIQPQNASKSQGLNVKA